MQRLPKQSKVVAMKRTIATTRKAIVTTSVVMAAKITATRKAAGREGTMEEANTGKRMVTEMATIIIVMDIAMIIALMQIATIIAVIAMMTAKAIMPTLYQKPSSPLVITTNNQIIMS